MKTLKSLPLFCLLFIVGTGRAATLTWINLNGGNWSNPANWSPNQTPGAADTAMITIDGDYTVMLDETAAVTNLVVGAPGGSGSVVFQTAGQLLNVGSTVTVNPAGSFNFNGGYLEGTPTLIGTMNWSAGTLAGGSLTVATNGILDITGAVAVAAPIFNAGRINWTGTGAIQVYNGNYGDTGGINNEAGAVFALQAGQTLNFYWGPEYFNNWGTVQKTGAGTTTTMNVPFNNYGTLDGQAGEVNLVQGGTASGQMVAEAGATLAIGSGYVGTTNSVFSGQGTNWFYGGTVSLSGTVNTSNTVVGGSCYLTGNGVFSGMLNWAASQFGNVTITNAGVLNITGGSTLNLVGELNNYGTVNWTGTGTLQVYNGNYGYTGGINNEAGAVFALQAAQTLNFYWGPEYFNNWGTVQKTGAGTTTTMNVPFNNYGTLDGQAGEVNLVQGGTASGQMVAEAGATLAIGNSYVGTTNSVFSGQGTNWFYGGMVSLSGTVNTSNTVVGGSCYLTGNGVFSGMLNWAASQFGDVTITNTGVLDITGGSTLNLVGELNNYGTVNWTGTGTLQVYNGNYGYTGGIDNEAGAVFALQAAQTLNFYWGPEYFNNWGTVQKTGAGTTTTMNVPFNNYGTLDGQAGEVNLVQGGTASGQMVAEAGATLAIGNSYVGTTNSVFSGQGTNWFYGGTVSLSGTVNTSNTVVGGSCYLTGNGVFSGMLNWAGSQFGDVTLTNTGVLDITGGSTLNLLGELNNYGTVNWTGTGTLQVYNGNYGDTGGINNESGAVFNFYNTQSIVPTWGPEYFVNAGLIQKSGAVGASGINVSFSNAGTLDVESGVVNIPNSRNLSAGALLLGIVNATNYGSVNLGGAAGLAGTVGVEVQAGYSPAASNVFNVVTYGSLSGAFTNFNLPSSLNWQTNYGATVFTVTAGYPKSALGWLAIGYTTNGSYVIDPNGNGPFTINTLMTLAGGGWTELTAAVANSLLNTNLNIARDYLYVQNGTSFYYRTPVSNLAWSWSSGQDLDGTYYYSTGAGESSFQVTASGEHQAYGVGGSSGPGSTLKCLVGAANCLNSNSAQVQLCQDEPGIFGSACQCGVTVYLRESGPVVPVAPPVITLQPTSTYGALGGSVQFSVAASGAVPFTYQWFFDETNALTGATNATLVLSQLNTNLAGYYSAVVGNLYGYSTSAVAALEVELVPNAETFDLLANFSTNQNPNGVWSYGWATNLGGLFTLATNPSVLAAGISGWGNGLSLPDTAIMEKNFTGSPLQSGTAVFDTDTLQMNPQSLADMVRFTAPYNAAYLINGWFRTQDTNAHPRVLSVLVNGNAEPFSVVAPGSDYNTNYPFGFTTNLAAGATVDFAVSGTNGDYADLSSGVSATIVMTNVVVPNRPIIIWTNPLPLAYGMPLTPLQLNAQAGGSGTFAYNPPAGAFLSAGANTLSVTFTPTDTADFSSSTDSVTLIVTPIPLSVTASNASRLYGQANPVIGGTVTGLVNGDNITADFVSAATPSSLPGTYPIVPVMIDPNNRLFNYIVTTNDGVLTVNETMLSTAWATPAPIYYGTALGGAQLDASANIPGAFTYTPAAGTVLNAGTNLLTAVFTPSDTQDFGLATNLVNLVVLPEPLTVTANSLSRPYLQANPVLTGALAGLVNGDSISATYSTTATTSSAPGAYPITPSLMDPSGRLPNYAVTIIDGVLTVAKLTPQITWSVPAPISYGVGLTTNQLNANASLPGAFTYLPGFGAVPSAGTNTLSVLFTPTDATDYADTSASVDLVVSPVPLTLTANNASRAYGLANPAFTGTISGLVYGDAITQTFGCAAVAYSPPGTYAIVPGVADPNNRIGNYVVSATNGTLTVSAGAPPTFSFVTPGQGLTNGGTSVTLVGTGFELGASVTFGSSPAASAVVNSGTQITAVTPPGPLTSVNVTVTNPDNTAVTLTNGFAYIGPPPTISLQPASQLLPQGSNAIFTVGSPDGTGWQWLFNGARLSDNGRIMGTHTSSLTITSLMPTDAGNYQAAVNNAWGTSVSAAAVLSIMAPPGITTPPQNQTVGAGGTALFTAVVSGTAPFAYQWFNGSSPLPGQTNSFLSLPNVQAAMNGNQYKVQVSNPSGSATSGAATLTVLNYCVSVQTLQPIYPMGSPVPLAVDTFTCSSQSQVPNSSANVYVTTGGSTRTLAVSTGASGSNIVTFVPLPTEYGTYMVSAGLPGQVIPAGTATFTLVGMGLSRNQIYQPLTPGLPVTNTIALTNLTGVALSDLTASLVGATPDVQVTLTAPNSLPGNGSGNLAFVMNAPANNTAQDEFLIQLTTAQGTTNLVYVTAGVMALYPQFTTTPATLTGAMLAGGQSLVSFYVGNSGGVTSGPVQVLLPSVPWLSTVTPMPLPPLAPGQSNQVTLALTPALNLPLGPYAGDVTLVSSNANLSIPFNFTCVSDLNGSLQVTVQDEYSLYGAGSPNVSNATVIVSDFLTGSTVVSGVTGQSGILLFTNLTSAYYTVAVSAPEHGTFSTTLLVAASQTNDVTAFLNLQLVDYTWVVTPTIIPDHYIFTLDTTFQTEVPWPVVTVSPGAIDLCGELGLTNQVNLTITNSGLIAAQQLNLNFGTNANWLIQPLVTSLGDLAPMSAIVVPVQLISIGSSTDGPNSIAAGLNYQVDALNQTNYSSVPIFVYDANPQSCAPTAPTPAPVASGCAACGAESGGGSGGGGGGGSGGFLSGGGGTGVDSPSAPYVQPPNYTFQAPDGAVVEVKLQITQSAVIARDAFNASLQLVNNSGGAVSNLTASIVVYNASNNVATTLFGIPAPQLSGLNAVDGTGTLAEGASGSADWTIVPTTNAAPTNATQFSVGGSFSYIFDGEPVTVPLFPVPISVLPTPLLDVDYFLQHDVYGQDPFTTQVEPSVPFALGLRVKNVGYGDAYDFTITSAQPQIIANSNDLLIAFQLIGSQVGTNQSLSPSFTIDLGNIGPSDSSEGLWYMTSTLEGEFVAFSATYQHVDDFGNTNTTLINSLNIHELNHVVAITVPADDGLPDFLVNDTTNVDAPPNFVYSSDGTTLPVTSVTSGSAVGTPTPTNLTVVVTVAPTSGWGYFEVIDPGGGTNPIASVTRSDGEPLLVGPNVWQTPERLHMIPPKPNALIHIFDYNSTGSYTVTYGQPVLAPSVTTLAAVLTPTNGTLNALINPNGAATDVYFQWGSTTNYGNETATNTLTDGLNIAQAVSLAVAGLIPNHTIHYRAVGVNSAGATYGADATAVTPPLPPPSIRPATNQITAVGQVISVPIGATVSTPPALYSLAPSDPAGATIGTNGVFRWQPACLQGGSTNLITIWVTDSGNPPLSNSMSFAVVVGECVELDLGSTVVQAGQTAAVPVTLLSTIGLTNLSWTLSNPDNRFTNWTFASSNAAIASVNSTRTFFNLGTVPGQTLQSPSLLGTLSMGTLPGNSAYEYLAATNILGAKTDGSLAGNISSQPGRIVVVGAQPLLEAQLGSNSTRVLILYDRLGTNYHLTFSTNLTSAQWQNGASGTVTNLVQQFNVDPSQPALFFQTK